MNKAFVKEINSKKLTFFRFLLLYNNRVGEEEIPLTDDTHPPQVPLRVRQKGAEISAPPRVVPYGT